MVKCKVFVDNRSILIDFPSMPRMGEYIVIDGMSRRITDVSYFLSAEDKINSIEIEVRQ